MRTRKSSLILAWSLVVTLLISACGTGSAGATPTGRHHHKTVHVSGSGYWHTHGVRILDSHNQAVRIAGVTWYGGSSSYWVPGGLDLRPYKKILKLIKKLGYNTVRLPFSNELVERNPIVKTKIRANHRFKGKHALQVMDAIIKYAGKIGLKIILDDHRSYASRPHSTFLKEGLWYNGKYNQKHWIHDWVTLAKRYKGNSTVIGFDLRNEPHTQGPGPWTVTTYLHQGATWGPYKGVDNPKTDWRLAAEKAGNAVLKVNPQLLIFVEGIQQYPDSRATGGVDSIWWSAILTPAKKYPVKLKVKHHLVYSPHDWGPIKDPQPWFKHMTFKSMKKAWRKYWSFILYGGHKSYAAPIWLGEFGTCNTYQGCVERKAKGNQGKWLQFLVKFLHKHPNVGWSYFALNGTNSEDERATDGLLNRHWTKPALPGLQKLLSGIQKP